MNQLIITLILNSDRCLKIVEIVETLILCLNGNCFTHDANRFVLLNKEISLGKHVSLMSATGDFPCLIQFNASQIFHLDFIFQTIRRSIHMVLISTQLRAVWRVEQQLRNSHNLFMYHTKHVNFQLSSISLPLIFYLINFSFFGKLS